MTQKKDNIYIYLWEEFNTIYIGRTVNPKSRHYQHKHRENESTYTFSSEHHVEHPKMIIIENDLTIEEGIEREKYWIEYYRKNSCYLVLNKSCGGQIVRNHKYTKEELKEHRKKYYEKNKERLKKYQKQHYEENKDKAKEYYEKNRSYISERRKDYDKMYYEKNKENIKKYRDLHKEERRANSKKYYEAHREEILKKREAYRLKKKLE
jgi:hypothetical protein